MNFLGHAAVARWSSADPRFVLGAMLPDFAHMAGLRRVAPRDAIASAGVALHHRTDDAFHGCPSFHALCRDGCIALQDEGVRRGPALGVTHVAVELLLDAALAHDDALVDDYRVALGVELELVDDAHALPLAGVRARLLQAGAPRWYGELDELAPRLERILAHHPRLALVAGEREPLQRWLRIASTAVADTADAMLDELRTRLDRG